MFSSAVVRRT